METLNQYLFRKGLFDDASSKEIQAAKKAYREIYKREHQKQYRRSNHRLELYFKPKDFSVLKKVALKQNKRVSTYVRESSLAYTQQSFVLPSNDAVRTLQMEIRKIGVNINQLVKFANIHRYFLSDDLDLMRQHLQIMDQKISSAMKQPLNVIQYLETQVLENPELLQQLKVFISKHETNDH